MKINIDGQYLECTETTVSNVDVVEYAQYRNSFMNGFTVMCFIMIFAIPIGYFLDK